MVCNGSSKVMLQALRTKNLVGVILTPLTPKFVLKLVNFTFAEKTQLDITAKNHVLRKINFKCCFA
jgi:hypothetical protein